MAERDDPTLPTGSGAWGDEPQRIGPYEVLGELGRGGQGVVYLARDTRLDRRVALKVLTRLGPGSEHVLARFKREAAVTSRLEHPGICGVIDAAIDGSIPYIAMRYVEGHSLARMIADSLEGPTTEGDQSIISFDLDDDGDDDAERAAADPSGRAPTRHEVIRVIKVFERAARALHAAHEAGVIHRDIKPGNIIIGPDDQPVLLDFGMAQDDEGDGPSITQSGDLFGTPAYMSPEQLMAQRIDLDRRTDVWSLGVTLYECLTLRRPFEAPTRQALYRTIMVQDPRDPRSINPAIPADLKVVLETALEKDCERRYQSAIELAEELRRVRCYEPITARPAGPVIRLRRWAQRNPAGAALVVALIILLPTTSWFFAKSLGDGKRAQLAQEKLEAEEKLRRKIEEDAEALAFADSKSRFVATTEDLITRFALTRHVLSSKADYGKVLQGAFDAFHAFGLPLDGSVSTPELVARLEALRKRDPALARKTLNTLSNFGWMFSEMGDEAITAPLAAQRKVAADFLDAGETDPWYRRVNEAHESFDGDPNHYAPFLEDEKSLTPDKLSWLGNTLCFVTMDSTVNEQGLRMIDRALVRDPANFDLRFSRGGFAMSRFRGQPDDPAIAEAVKQFETCVAIRPESGLAWSMLGMIYGAARRHQDCLTCIEKAVELSPEDSLCWYFRGFLTGMARDKAESIRSFERALEIDPSFSRARDDLERVRAGKPPRPPNQPGGR